MSIDVSGFTQAITDGGASALAVCLAWGVAVWGVRAVKLITTDTPRYGNGVYEPGDDQESFSARCPCCGGRTTFWQGPNDDCPVCEECGYEHSGDEDDTELLVDGTQPLSDYTGMPEFYHCDHCGLNSVDDAWAFDDGEDYEECPQCGGDITVEDVS